MQDFASAAMVRLLVRAMAAHGLVPPPPPPGADGLAAIRRRDARRERQPSVFGDRQRVHVGAQRDARAGMRAAQDAADAGRRDAGAHVLEAERTQVLRHQRGGTRLVLPEFWMGVEVAAPRDDVVVHAGGQVVEGLRRQRLRRQRGGDEEREEDPAHGVSMTMRE